MVINIEGKNVEFCIHSGEKEDCVLDEVRALLGVKGKAVSKKVGYSKDVSLFDIIEILEDRFEIGISFYGIPNVVHDKMRTIIFDPESAAVITKNVIMANLDDRELGLSKFLEIVPTKDIKFFWENEGIVKVDAINDIIKIMIQNREIAVSPFTSTNFTAGATLTDSEFNELKEEIPGLERTVILMEPTKEITASKPIPKSINVEVIKPEVNTKDKKFEIIDDRFVSTTDAKSIKQPDVKITETDKETVKIINNPEQNITLANTQQIVTRINIELLKKYINIDSLKNAPAELKAKIMTRLEGAIKVVLKESKDYHDFLDSGKKYGLSKTTFFGEDKYTLFNGKKYWKFVDAENFEFGNKLN